MHLRCGRSLQPGRLLLCISQPACVCEDMSGVPRHVLLVAFSFLLVLLRFSSDGGGASGFVFPYTSGSGRGTPTAHQRATRTVHQCRTRAAYRRLQVLSLAPQAQKAVVEGAQRVASSLGAGLSGKEAVDQAGERLIPLFAEVDAHTKRWVTAHGRMT